ncbi:MAG: tryptophan-rich sensory protein, partial [Tardiphaga sp.]
MWKPVLVAAVAAIAVASVGGLLTDIGPWYQNLRKPSWQPPDRVF